MECSNNAHTLISDHGLIVGHSGAILHQETSCETLPVTIKVTCIFLSPRVSPRRGGGSGVSFLHRFTFSLVSRDLDLYQGGLGVQESEWAIILLLRSLFSVLPGDARLHRLQRLLLPALVLLLRLVPLPPPARVTETPPLPLSVPTPPLEVTL